MFGADSSARVPRRDPRGLDVVARRRPKMQSSTGTRIAADTSNFDYNRATLRSGSSEIRLLASQHLPPNSCAMLRRTRADAVPLGARGISRGKRCQALSVYLSGRHLHRIGMEKFDENGATAAPARSISWRAAAQNA